MLFLWLRHFKSSTFATQSSFLPFHLPHSVGPQSLALSICLLIDVKITHFSGFWVLDFSREITLYLLRVVGHFFWPFHQQTKIYNHNHSVKCPPLLSWYVYMVTFGEISKSNLSHVYHFFCHFITISWTFFVWICIHLFQPLSLYFIRDARHTPTTNKYVLYSVCWTKITPSNVSCELFVCP